VSSAAAEQASIVVEDWSKPSNSGTGIPEGWSGHRWGNAKYDFALITDGLDRVLRLRSRGDNSTISKAVAGLRRGRSGKRPRQRERSGAGPAPELSAARR
jgi:hypothetical protein